MIIFTDDRDDGDFIAFPILRFLDAQTVSAALGDFITPEEVRILVHAIVRAWPLLSASTT